MELGSLFPQLDLGYFKKTIFNWHTIVDIPNTVYIFIFQVPTRKKLDWYDNISNKTEISFYNFSFIFIQVFIFLPIQLYLSIMGNKLVEKNLKWHGFKKVEKQDQKTSDIE